MIVLNKDFKPLREGKKAYNRFKNESEYGGYVRDSFYKKPENKSLFELCFKKITMMTKEDFFVYKHLFMDLSRNSER